MDLNTILIILGVLALISLIVHGVWSNRKEKSQYFENEKTFTQELRIREPAQSFNNKLNQNWASTETENKDIHTNTHEIQQPLDFGNDMFPNSSMNIEKGVDEIKITLPKSNHSLRETLESPLNHIPNLADTSIEDLENTIDPEEGINSSSPIVREQLSKMSQDSYNKERVIYPMDTPSKYEPKNRSNTTKIDDRVEPHYDTSENVSENPQTDDMKNENANNNNEDNFIMLYIVAPENRDFNGTNIAQVLDDLGFIYGEKEIYHRHVDLSIASPILFSVSNIQQPGTFDPENMADFYTIGLAIFMQLPSYGNDLVNLRLMIRAARNIAEELGGFVLTDKQVIFTDEAEQEYLNKVA